MNNWLFGINGGYFVAESLDDVHVWSISGAVGYAIRLMENHVNIIPSFSGGYSELSFPFGSDSSTSISPGIQVSYAFNNKLSVNAGYSYLYDVDSEADAHGFSVGSVVAVAEHVGVHVAATFTESDGFSGISAGVAFHF
jgi:hypothetical protein